MGVVIRGPSRSLAPFVERLGYHSGGCAEGWELGAANRTAATAQSGG